MSGATLAPLKPLQLQTGRLRFTEFEGGDAETLYALFSDPQAMRYWSREPMQDPAEAVQLIDEIATLRERDELYQWALRLEDGTLIGTATLHAFSLVNRRCGIGYMLARAHWGRGLMHEALDALISHVFEFTGIERIGADVDPRNVRSIALLKRLGFREEGLRRATYRLYGEVQDSKLMGLLAKDRVPPGA